MEHFDNLNSNEPASPHTIARQIRSGCATYFGAPVVCAVAAIFFAAEHKWMYSAAFAASGLFYLPIALLQCRNDRNVCETAIQGYEQWHEQHQGQ